MVVRTFIFKREEPTISTLSDEMVAGREVVDDSRTAKEPRALATAAGDLCVLWSPVGEQLLASRGQWLPLRRSGSKRFPGKFRLANLV